MGRPRSQGCRYVGYSPALAFPPIACPLTWRHGHAHCSAPSLSCPAPCPGRPSTASLSSSVPRVYCPGPSPGLLRLSVILSVPACLSLCFSLCFSQFLCLSVSHFHRIPRSQGVYPFRTCHVPPPPASSTTSHPGVRSSRCCPVRITSGLAPSARPPCVHTDLRRTLPCSCTSPAFSFRFLSFPGRPTDLGVCPPASAQAHLLSASPGCASCRLCIASPEPSFSLSYGPAAGCPGDRRLLRVRTGPAGFVPQTHPTHCAEREPARVWNNSQTFSIRTGHRHASSSSWPRKTQPILTSCPKEAQVQGQEPGKLKCKAKNQQRAVRGCVYCGESPRWGQ